MNEALEALAACVALETEYAGITNQASPDYDPYAWITWAHRNGLGLQRVDRFLADRRALAVKVARANDPTVAIKLRDMLALLETP